MNTCSFLLRCASALFLVLLSTNRAFAGAGDLDTSFGVNGITPSEPGNTIAIIVQPDGKIVSLASNSGSYWLARYGSAGNLDVSFNGTGKVTIGLTGTSIALQADGKILVVGGTSPAGGILRYNPDGSVDTTFNGTGQVATDLVRSIAVQSDGKIVVSGPVSSGASAAFGVGRYNANGSLDMSFNGCDRSVM